MHIFSDCDQEGLSIMLATDTLGDIFLFLFV